MPARSNGHLPAAIDSVNVVPAGVESTLSVPLWAAALDAFHDRGGPGALGHLLQRLCTMGTPAVYNRIYLTAWWILTDSALRKSLQRGLGRGGSECFI
jgi:hypothetical protein